MNTAKRILIGTISAVIVILLMLAGKMMLPKLTNKVKDAAGTNVTGTKTPGKIDPKTGKVASDVPYRNVVYYGDWSIYEGQKCYYPSRIDGSMITHLNFAFMDMDANGDLVLCDEHADFQATLPEQEGLTYGDPYAGVFGAMSILRSKYPNMKIGVSVGGWTRSGDFPAVAADSSKRENFAKNIAKFVDYLGYDFVDIDWEYPCDVRESDPEANGVSIDEGCPGTDADGKNFILLLEAIRTELNALTEKNGKYYELSVAMSASPAKLEKIEFDKVLEIVDFANMMTYDLNGAWNPYTGHQTALYTNDAFDEGTQPEGVFSVDHCINYLKDTYGKRIDLSQVVIGVAPYTRAWAGVQSDGRDKKCPGLFATATPNSVKSLDGTLSGTFAYSDIETLKAQYQLKEYYDEKAEAPYYYSEETGYFFTCDNERSVAAKGEYVKKNGLGGMISWMASLDGNGTITKTMKESMYGNDALPEREILVNNPAVSVSVTAEGSAYSLTITNNETAEESNPALKSAELFKKTVMNPKLYIKSKSGAAFSAGTESGAVSTENGMTVVDLSSVYNAKTLKPGGSHTFTLNVSGNADTADIEGISMTQRILLTLGEFGEQTVYGNGADGTVAGGSTGDADGSGAESSSENNTESDTEEMGNNNATGTYEAWVVGTSYILGDVVAHEGKVYECIFAHTSQSDWAPGTVPTLWKERTDLVNAAGNGAGNSAGKEAGDSVEEKKPAENNYTANKTLPKHMVTGYWHNFDNGSTVLKLGDVPKYYDMICVSFTGNTQTPGEVTFSLDQGLSNALGGYTKEEFIKDIKDLKKKGQYVIVSVGGAEGRIDINSKEAADLFAKGLIQIIEEYGFEGVDIDLEGSAVSGVEYIAEALRDVHDHFGDDFIITMAPETFYFQGANLAAKDITTSYLRLAMEIKDILTICYPQFYNTGGMNGYGGTMVSPGNADFLTSLSTLLIETGGLRADQVAIGVPCLPQAAGSGYVTTDIVETAVNAMVNGTSSGAFTVPKKYSDFRGVMTWSINWDATNNYEWGKAMSKAMDKLD